MMVAEACPPTRDTVCAPHCAPGHFLHAENGSSSRCLPCQACGLGSGVVALCRPTTNTVCQRCPEGFYSEEKSAVAPCLPCRRECSEDEVMIRGCSPGSDTLCMERELQILKRTEGDPRKDYPRKPSLAEHPPPRARPAAAGQQWPSCKQKQQLAKARAGELGASPEGEKLHSDSGVFLDTHSLQEHHALNKGSPDAVGDSRLS
nr:tumor necrosis factor receptor superfamily member 16-like [Pelodiscus sinensis]|eukprot:XP_006114483.1 tumor necrosis factor receptor superfamily member 16-like [Pelodiscus sinensis]